MDKNYNTLARKVANEIARTGSEEMAARLLGISEAEILRCKQDTEFWDSYHIAGQKWRRVGRFFDSGIRTQ